MDTGSFYQRAVRNRDDGFGRYTSPITTSLHETPPSLGSHYHSQDPLVSVNQKLDKLMCMMMNQKSAIDEGRKEAAEMKEQMTLFAKELGEVKATISQQQDDTHVSRAGKKRVPRDLSVSVKQLHSQCNPEKQFRGSETYNSKHNQEVKAFLQEQLTMKFMDSFTPRRIKRCVHRYYESRRRLHNDCQPSRKQKAEVARSRSHKQGLRRQLYLRRMRHVKGEDEAKKWKSIDHRCMTEESDSDGEVVRQHPLSWRSQELNSLIKKLDRRYTKSARKGNYVSKERVRSTISTTMVHHDCPSWAVRPDCDPSVHPSTPTRLSQSSQLSNRTLDFTGPNNSQSTSPSPPTLHTTRNDWESSSSDSCSISDED